MNKISGVSRCGLLSGASLMVVTLSIFSATLALAESADKEAEAQEIVVVGSQIRGSKTAEMLPVTVVSKDQIDALGVVTGDDLLRTIPEMGGVEINPTVSQQTSNSARGDVGSIDLRGAGIGDTLVLLNGRRIVEYPTSQSHGNVPLIFYNSQSLPVGNTERLEVLRDGAGAIYGSDAVAGVVNLVTNTNFDGFKFADEAGWAQGTHLRQYSETLAGGTQFDGGRGHLSMSVDLSQRTALLPSDEPYTATTDLRSYFAGYAGYNTSSAPDGRASQSSWPSLVALGLSSAVKQGTTALTTAAGSFHIQPSTLAGCVSQIANGLCIATGAISYSGADNSLRYNQVQNDATTINPAITREIGQFNAYYDINADVRAYTELDYYHAASHGLTTDGTTLVAVGVPASNYYNPFGAVTLPNGQPNPNRLPNLTNVPASGLAVTIAGYRFNDLGPDPVDVDSYQARGLIGATGNKWGFDWDTALLYGASGATDVSGTISSTALASQLALATPAAYNPFNGSCLNGAGGGDCTPSSASSLAAIYENLKRTSTSTLLNADFKVSKQDLLMLPAGPLGIASGVEARRETHEDFRAPSVNGTEPFTDPVTGLVSTSSATGVSVTPSTSGSRSVFSTYAELAVPVVSPEMGIPLIRQINMQLAGRYEDYSDFGSVVKPKAAASWDVVDGVRLRSSWQEGFKAPNLETTNPFSYARAQTVTDYYRCQADLNTHRIKSFSACTDTDTVSYYESGNPALKPESSKSFSYGVVLQPKFNEETLGKLTFTADQWLLLQQAVVGVVGPANLAVGDYVNRIQNGSGTGAVVRAAPTADDIAAYAGSGLAPAGTITQVLDTFTNLQPQTIRGLDLGALWQKDFASYGALSAGIDATYLEKYYQSQTTQEQSLFQARSSGLINAATPLTGGGNQIKVLGNPKWRATASLTWRLDPFQVGLSSVFTGETLDTGFLSTSGAPWNVKSLTVINAYAQYTFTGIPYAHEVAWRLGARNLWDVKPPIESDGYNGALYVPYRRYLYTSLSANF